MSTDTQLGRPTMGDHEDEQRREAAYGEVETPTEPTPDEPSEPTPDEPTPDEPTPDSDDGDDAE